MMSNQQVPSQGSQPNQAQFRAVQQQFTPQQMQQQFQQQQLIHQHQLHNQVQVQQQQTVNQGNQQQSQQSHQQQQSPAIYLPQPIMIQPNTQAFTAMPNGGNFIQMTPFGKKPMILPNDSKGPRGKMLISSAPQQLQPINSFVGQSPQPIGNQYYTLQTFPSPGGPVQNSATLLSPNNHQYLFTVSPNAFQNQPIVFNQNSIPVSVAPNASPVISIAHTQSRPATKVQSAVQNTGQPCLIAPAAPLTTATATTTQRLKTIKPATDPNKASIGTQTQTGQTILPGSAGAPITIPIHIQHQPIHQQQHIQLQLQPQSQPNPPSKTSKAIQSTNKDRSSNLDTATTVTLVPQRTNNTANTVINKPTKNKLIAANAPLKEKVIQSSKKKTTTSGTDTGDLADHCPDTNNLTNGVTKSNGSKSPQRAIVKPYVSDPNVLTHVIDGFVIQESQQPFQVISEDTIIDPMEEDNVIISETQTQKTKTAKGEAVCENCQKSITKFNKKKKLKRFCSNMCAKKSNNLMNHNPNNDGTTTTTTTTTTIRNGNEDFEMSEVQQDTMDTQQSASKKMKTDVPTNKVTETTEPLDSSIDGGYIPAGGSNPNLWNVQDVYDFVRHLPGCQEYADEFKSQEIDGQALMLLKEDHLMSAMNMKLGPALKICSRITSLFRAEANKSQA